MNEYEQQATDFVKATGLTIKKRYQGHRPYFHDDKEQRAVWSIIFEREGRQSYTFTYGDSIANSYEAKDGWRRLSFQQVYRSPLWKAAAESGTKQSIGGMSKSVTPVFPEPTDYDLLACMDGNGPISFSEFCADYGYDDDSIKARDTYIKVQEECAAMQRLFSEAELAQLSQIA